MVNHEGDTCCCDKGEWLVIRTNTTMSSDTSKQNVVSSAFTGMRYLICKSLIFLLSFLFQPFYLTFPFPLPFYMCFPPTPFLRLSLASPLWITHLSSSRPFLLMLQKVLQVASRIITYLLNNKIIVEINIELFGVCIFHSGKLVNSSNCYMKIFSIQYQLIMSTILLLTREGFRTACQRSNIGAG